MPRRASCPWSSRRSCPCALALAPQAGPSRWVGGWALCVCACDLWPRRHLPPSVHAPHPKSSPRQVCEPGVGVWGHLLREVKDCTRSEITCVQCRTVRLASPQALLEHVQPSTLRRTRPHAPARTLMSALPTQAPQGPQLTRSPAPSPAPSALAPPLSLPRAQVLANYFSLTRGPNFSGMAVHYDVHIVSRQDVDKPRGRCRTFALQTPWAPQARCMTEGMPQDEGDFSAVNPPCQVGEFGMN